MKSGTIIISLCVLIIVGTIGVWFMFPSYIPSDYIAIGAIVVSVIIISIILIKSRSVKAYTTDNKIHTEIAKQLTRTEQELFFYKHVKDMSGIEFEKYTSIILRFLGYAVYPTYGNSMDYGTDLIAVKSDKQGKKKKTAIQCKQYQSNVSNQVVSIIDSSRKIYQCDSAWVITTSKYTRNAILTANTCGVKLIDGELLKYMKKSILAKSPKLIPEGKEIKPTLIPIKEGSALDKLIKRQKTK